MPAFNQSRSYIVRIIIGVVFFVILLQLFRLQVLSSEYSQLAQDNAIFKKVVYPPRGILYDRTGKAIVNNTLVHDLMVTPRDARKADTALLCSLLGIDVAEYAKRMTEAIMKNGQFRPSAFEDLLTPEKYTRLEENIWRLQPGFFLQERPIRTYPFGVGAHFLGYVGEVDTAIIRRTGGFYQQGDYVGRSGLESFYERVLMGQRGVKFIIKDNHNRLQGPYAGGIHDTAEVAGRGVRTYVDVELQQLAEKLMQGKLGAVVAIEPKTGGILAMASGPGFSPEELTGAAFKKTYSQFVLDASKPLLNRAIKGQYPPGSTFKPMGGLVALDQGLITPSFGFGCGGRYYSCGHGKPACTHAGGGHAANLRLAIANSCNSYFTHVYRMAADNPKYGNVKVGYAHWRGYMNAFGLGVRLGVDLPGEDKGNITDTTSYNRQYRNAWNSCTNLTLGIGQDQMLATPLQLANAMCIIANRGYYYTPHFIKSIDGETAADTILRKFRIRHEPLTSIPDSSFEAVIAGMQDVVERGTARNARIPGINVCAKTGTAENYVFLRGRKMQLKDHSMFVCFAPRENPKIAICVVVENGGFGASAAGPICTYMMEKYLNDTLRPETLKKVEELSKRNLMPPILKLRQYIEDSTRAELWLKTYNDSSRIKKFIQANRAKRDSAMREQMRKDSIQKAKLKADSTKRPKPQPRIANRIRLEALENRTAIRLCCMAPLNN